MRDPITRFQPSTSTNRRTLKGAEICHDFGTLQGPSVRAGGWLESGDRVPHERLLYIMNSLAVVQIVRDALMMAFWLAAPVLIVGFVAGIVMSLLQIVTSIQDSAFSTVPRLAAVLAALILAMPWILQKASTYAISILGNLSRYAQ